MCSSYIEGVRVARLGTTASHQQPPRPSFSLSPHALPTLFLCCLLRMCFQVSLSFTFFSFFFFPFASPPSSETESLTKLDRLVCPLSFLCTSECVLESRVTDGVALRWFCSRGEPCRFSVPLAAWPQSCPVPPGGCGGLDVRARRQCPCLPHPALQG